jgi:YHS domain-containing protein
MANNLSLSDRIDAEFNAAKERVADLQQQWTQQFEERKQRLDTFERLLENLKDVWRSRLEALSKRFADRVDVTPSVEAGRRQATFKFKSELANIDLRFTVLPDQDARNVIFQYDLDIIPILMKFDSHDEIQFPLDSINQDALAKWFDDRIISFVKTYLAVHDNQYYLKDHLVEDPIAKVRFPKYAAGAKLDWKGKTVYFLGDETRRQFELQQGPATK